MRLPRSVFPAFFSLLSVVGPAWGQPLLPHRAVYDLALLDASDESDIDGHAARWVYDFSGSSCQGYTLKSRIVMRFEMSDGPSTVDQQVISYEGGDGKTFRFVTKSYINQELDSEIKGTARLGTAGTVVDYEKPEKTKHVFARTLFPTAQLKEMLGKAHAGEHFYQSSIFDGTELADKPVMVSVVVGDPKPVDANDPERKALGALARDGFRPVTAAYFDGEGKDGEE